MSHKEDGNFLGGDGNFIIGDGNFEGYDPETFPLPSKAKGNATAQWIFTLTRTIRRRFP